MENKKRLIEELREMAERTPPICQYDKPQNITVFDKEITVYCKPFEQFQELLLRAADALSVDVVEVSRLGELGRLMMAYEGCPRGRMGVRGDGGITELDPIKDVEGDRWVPVLEEDLNLLKVDAVEVVHGRWLNWKELFPNKFALLSLWKRKGFCSHCGAFKEKDKYCPNCGAKMDGDKYE